MFKSCEIHAEPLVRAISLSEVLLNSKLSVQMFEEPFLASASAKVAAAVRSNCFPPLAQ